MNTKKILSSALVVVLLLGCFIGLIPPKAAEAAHYESADKNALTSAEIKAIVQKSYEYEFNNAREMLEFEAGCGYLVSVSSKGNEYTIHVNRYTGTMYYVNNVTGQVLTSNPYNPKKVTTSSDLRMQMMSQITVGYLPDNGSISAVQYLYGSKDAGERAQIKVSFIKDGIRVGYTLGDTTTRFIVPMVLTEEAFITCVFTPMVEYTRDFANEYLSEKFPDTNFDFFAQDTWGKYNVYNKDGHIENRAFQQYIKTVEDTKDALKRSDPIRAELLDLTAALSLLSTSFFYTDPVNDFDISNPEKEAALKALNEKYPITKDGVTIYECSQKNNNVQLRKLQTNLAKYASYSLDQLTENEAECDYVHQGAEHPVFRCYLEYSFNEDGTLSVRLPANSITFDEATYNIEGITPLQFFGAGDLREEGYVFIPDGSGSIIDFEDFYTEDYKHNISIKLGVYGDDYAYATPTAKHREQVSMPVYGIVSKTPANSKTEEKVNKSSLDSGFFAILEEGASLASLYVKFGGSAYPYATTYAYYEPFPSDDYALSSGGTGTTSSTYTIVSNSRYTGSYVTRYVMLGDSDLTAASGADLYDSSYVGMATYYREYLKARGELSALEEVEEDLPLYIEALGSMTVLEKILTFPVNVSKPLTTFDDIVTMYDELSDARAKFEEKKLEYEKKAEAQLGENAELHRKYTARAAEYQRLIDALDANEMKSITNICFKLTGFANGGMYYTYPSNVAWEKACGGAAGFNTLISSAKDRTDKVGSFLVYPEFDFLYMSNTRWNDGVSESSDLSRMVDSSYASKKQYNSVLAIYESAFTMVISPDVIEGFFDKFDANYSTYGLNAISLSTVGSDLNSNFNKKNAINREESLGYVVSLLDSIASGSKYSVMVDKGNMYTIGYVDHILDASIDSSHLGYSSYTIPFTGLVLHGYVNYTGSPINYAGTPDYDILRAIENGASLYYILCYQNTEFMKEDPVLNQYYGVDYINWYDKIFEQYNVLNSAIGDLQKYEITDHKVILAERVIDRNELAANNERLKAEFLELVDAAVMAKVNAAFDEMYGDPANIGRGVSVTVDADTLLAQASRELNIAEDTLKASGFYAKLVAIKEKYEGNGADVTGLYPSKPGAYEVSLSEIVYSTKYDYVTDSSAFDEDYDVTDYTATNKRVVIVTYTDPETGDEVKFILNYNLYDVTVRLDANTVYPVPKYGFVRI